MKLYNIGDIVSSSQAAIKVNKNGTLTYTNSLKKAFAFGNSSATITLFKYIALTESLVLSVNACFTPDLNGKTIGGADFSVTGSTAEA